MKVTICSSNRFAEEVMEFAHRLEELGVVVYVPHFYTHNHGDLADVDEVNQPFIAMGLTHDQFTEIRYADVVFIYNKDGYAGYSTSMEIGYAFAKDKPVYALAEDEDICRNVLYRGICKTPEELVAELNA